MAIGDTITAARYNNLQSRIASIMGNGTGQSGYGQTLSSSQVTTGALVEALHMQNLYDDMFAARVHQTGTVPLSIANMSIQDLIGENSSTDPNGAAKGYTDFENLMPSIEGDKFLLYPSQASIELATTSTRTASWNGTLTHEFTVTFSDEDHRRHFFNAGGEIRFSASLIGGVGAKSIDWATLLTNMQTIKFNYANTVSTGAGTGSAIGNYSLTTSYQTIFIKSGSGIYAIYDANDYTIAARAPTTNTIQFRIQFNDDIVQEVDENVIGTVTSSVQQYRPTGLYVSVPTPSYVNNTSL